MISSREFTATAGEAREIRLELVPQPPPSNIGPVATSRVAPVVPTAHTSASSSVDHGSPRTWVLVGGSAATVVAAGLGVFFTLRESSLKSDSNKLQTQVSAEGSPALVATNSEFPPSAKLVITPSAGDPITFALTSGIDRGDGLLSFLIPSPQPGVLYTAEMQIRPSEPRTPLFKDFELNQLVAQSNGASADPLSKLGADALVFESRSGSADDEEAVQGGPDEPSDQQLASFDAQAGTVAVA